MPYPEREKTVGRNSRQHFARGDNKTENGIGKTKKQCQSLLFEQCKAFTLKWSHCVKVASKLRSKSLAKANGNEMGNHPTG